MEIKLKPFTLEWTVNKTIDRMCQCIDFSLERATSRIVEFSEDREKSEEILRTISSLVRLKKLVNRCRPSESQSHLLF